MLELSILAVGFWVDENNHNDCRILEKEKSMLLSYLRMVKSARKKKKTFRSTSIKTNKRVGYPVYG